MEIGLVYEIKIKEGGKVKITMTFTAPACPVAGEIIMEVENKVRAIEGSYRCSCSAYFRSTMDKRYDDRRSKI